MSGVSQTGDHSAQSVIENTDSSGNGISGNLRQMIAVLEQERQALATLDADALFEASHQKQTLCETLQPFGADALDHQSRDLAKTAQALNDVNRRVRNLLAANVSARLEALGSTQHTYMSVNKAYP
ncbi:MAG: flagellar protein FlgN [Erythrobacter sp.]